MKTIRSIFMVSLLLLSVFLVTLVYAQGSTDSQPDGATAEPDARVAAPGSDSNPDGTPEVLIPDHLQPAVAPAGTNGPEAVIYFTPQDESTSTTILFIYNTGTLTATVGIETFQLDGSPYINTNVMVPPQYLVRIAADTVSTVSNSWEDAVLINFTTFSTYGRLTLPESVKAEGYVVWNDAGTYDPLQVAPTLPLRFSTDPATIFLPNIQRD